MKKGKIVGIIIVVAILIGLIVFASTRKFEDSHLRKEGKRVRMTYETLVVDDCNDNTKNFTYCERTINVGNEEAKLVFELVNINDNGYPETVKASINGHEFYKKDGLDIENDSNNAYKIFLNFHVIGDEYIVFTLTDGMKSMSTTIYVIDTNGNIILQEQEVDTDNMIVKDYGDFITFEDDSFTVYASRVKEDNTYHDETICNAKGKDIVEAYYTYTYKNGKITKKQAKTVTASKFIEEHSIVCKDKD